ncbi:MAG: gluconokinase [Burkholderiaceae bacterium]|nr:gluconokinase [Burkholderiaceae bacterium]
MGVSGCGKTSVGRRIAQALGLAFVEGDELHPPRNVALMAAGTPLTDADRADWLAAIAALLGQAHDAGRGLVVSCSALRRRYRDRLRAACPGLRFVFLHGDPALLRERMTSRRGHYMPASLLDTQLATLEPPDADEDALAVDVGPAVEQVTTTVLAGLKRCETTAR